MWKPSLTKPKGFSLIELMVGMVITGVVGLGAFKFFEGSQKAQIESALKGKASSEIMSFLQNRRKTISKADPQGAITPASNIGKTLTIKKKVVNPKTLAVTNYYEKIEVSCGTPSAGILSNLPASYKCGNVCNDDNKAPMYVTVYQATTPAGPWNAGEVYPSPQPTAFLDGNKNKLAMSLCMNLVTGTNLLKLTGTYLVRPSSTEERFELTSQTVVVEVPNAPASGIQPGPEVLGSF